jgi:mono/diheme cytochrome c family protein
MRRLAPLIVLLVLLVLLAACDQYSMANQKKYKSYEVAELLPDGSAMQTPVPGTVWRGEAAELAVLDQRPPMTMALLERGRERFNIFCSPCHGRAGDGEGVIVQRGFPHPPSYHIDRLRNAPDRHFLDVIENGYGVMYSYAARVPPADRWTIVAYIRALQLGQHAVVADLPKDVRRPLPEQQR